MPSATFRGKRRMSVDKGESFIRMVEWGKGGGSILLLLPLASRRSLLLVLSLDPPRSAASQGRLEGEVDVLLGVKANNKRGDVDDLLANPDVPLANEHPCVVDALGQAKLEDLRLKAALKEVVDAQGQHVVQLHLRLVQHADANKATQQRIAFKEPARVFFVEREQLSGGRSDLSDDELDAPDLALIAQAKLADQLQLLVQPLLLKGTAGGGVRLAAYQLDARHSDR
jgi:hypothetical protein